MPFRWRVSALRSCVQLYRPLGYHATLDYLRERAGRFDRDEAALLRALDALRASRAGWHADLREYAAARAEAKRHGQRSPRPGERNPNHKPAVWYGAPRDGALHALTYWRRKRLEELRRSEDPAVEAVDSCVGACLAAGGPLGDAERERLAGVVRELGERLAGGLYDEDYAAYCRTRELLSVAALVSTADGSGVPQTVS